MNGIELIAKERDRQINVEGFTADHDSQYQNEELVLAAIAYIEADETDIPMMITRLQLLEP